MCLFFLYSYSFFSKMFLKDFLTFPRREASFSFKALLISEFLLALADFFLCFLASSSRCPAMALTSCLSSRRTSAALLGVQLWHVWYHVSIWNINSTFWLLRGIPNHVKNFSYSKLRMSILFFSFWIFSAASSKKGSKVLLFSGLKLSFNSTMKSLQTYQDVLVQSYQICYNDLFYILYLLRERRLFILSTGVLFVEVNIFLDCPQVTDNSWSLVIYID